MTDAQKAEIERINQVSAMARTSWLTLLAYLAFVGVTLLGVEDADFFVPTRQTQLPLVNVAIPTASFFTFAPVLAAALYVYLHIVLLKLWNAIAGVTDEEIDGQTLGDHLHPWLVNDWALTRKGGPFVPARPLLALGNLASFLLIWAAAPAVLLGFWWRSLPAHNLSLTLLLVACVILALHSGAISWLTADAWLERPRRPMPGLERSDLWFVLLLGLLFGGLTVIGTRFPLTFGEVSTLVPANLARVDMVGLPDGWRAPEAARHAFRETWCRREGLTMAVCDHLPDSSRALPPYAVQEREEWCGSHTPPLGTTCADVFARLDARFRADWTDERRSTIADLPGLNLSGRDLRHTVASEVILVGANLGQARLEGAGLWWARLEGANFAGARLEGARLGFALVEGADFSSAALDRAELHYARLEGAAFRSASLAATDFAEARLEDADFGSADGAGADFSRARLEGANLGFARLPGANFSSARLNLANLGAGDFAGATWTGAYIRAAIVADADFRGAQGLTQAQLDESIGNAGTLLPDGASDTGEAWYVWSCWDQPPPDLDRLVATIFSDADDEVRDDLRRSYLCNPGAPRRKTGTPLGRDAPYPEGHMLADRN